MFGEPSAVFADLAEEFVNLLFGVHGGEFSTGLRWGKEFFCLKQNLSVDDAEKCCLIACMTNATTEAMPPAELEIPLSDLPEATKDFLLASAASGRSVREVIAEHLDRAAVAAGFSPMNTPNNAAA